MGSMQHATCHAPCTMLHAPLLWKCATYHTDRHCTAGGAAKTGKLTIKTTEMETIYDLGQKVTLAIYRMLHVAHVAWGTLHVA